MTSENVNEQQLWDDTLFMTVLFLANMGRILGRQDFLDEEGILHQVSYGTAVGKDSRQFYKDIILKPMPYGQALAILFFLEVLKEI